MNTLPLDCLVAYFLACESRHDSLEDDGGVYSIPIDDTRWLGVQASETEDLLFFAHPGPEVNSGNTSQDDEGSSEQFGEDLEVGEDIDGSWVLTADGSSGCYTLWIRVEWQRVGHTEFARIVDSLRSRFAVWDKVLANRNAFTPEVTQGVFTSQRQDLHGTPFA